MNISSSDRSTILHRLRHPELHGSILGRTGLAVTGAGFGGYRVSSGITTHGEALRHALLSGINLIDTSANYADGGSEELIGEILSDLIAKDSIRRDEIVLVSKGGYMQGRNLERATERIESGGGFPDVVQYADGLWHCIDPEFLDDQITRTLERLGLDAVDVYLLHNPEYYLQWAQNNGLPVDQARAEYYRRIERAFRFLEGEVARGRISWYGISSNTFVRAASAYDHTSLEECIRIAEQISGDHHFAVIQFPGNLLEPGFAQEKNSSDGKTLIESARGKELGTLINRPLNAIVDDELIRLADFPHADAPAAERDIERVIAALEEMEEEFRRDWAATMSDDEEEVAALREFVAAGRILREHWREFGTIEVFNHALSGTFTPRLAYASEVVRGRGIAAEQEWFDRYMGQAREALRMVASRYAAIAQERTNDLRERLAASLGTRPEGSFSAIAIRSLLGVPGITSVLVGMRRVEYVNDVIATLTAGKIESDRWWSAQS